MCYGWRMTNQLSLDEVARRNIRAELARSNMTQAMLVAELGKNQSWLTRRLRPTKPAPFTFTDLEDVATVLSTTADQLIRR